MSMDEKAAIASLAEIQAAAGYVDQRADEKGREAPKRRRRRHRVNKVFLPAIST
jgi:Mn-dependent DtxR family transcriptional regulator